MTEEIIIDCAFYKDCVCASPINKTCEYCKNIDVSKCYHKQLKRIEQENKDLKKQIESDKGLITVGGKQQYQYLQRIDELEQENKELKIKLSSTKCYLCGEGFLTPEGAELYEEKENYRSALEEIKNNFMCFRSCMIPFHVGDKDNLPHKMADAIQNYCESIINKINECIGE